MSTDDVQIDRKSLYKLVWSQPISKLAETYGYSDVGFAKLCHKPGIPLPSRGHWAKLKAGRAVTQLPLPPAKHHEQKHVCLLPLSEPERLVLACKREREATIRGSISCERFRRGGAAASARQGCKKAAGSICTSR